MTVTVYYRDKTRETIEHVFHIFAGNYTLCLGSSSAGERVIELNGVQAWEASAKA